MSGPAPRYRIFSRGDLSAFWALFADNLANIVIIAGTCTLVFRMPDRIVFGRIMPGLGVALLFGLGLYVLLACRLARRERRDDVTALPYGISTPVMFVYLFGVIGPAYGRTGDAVLAWQVGIAAAFIGGVIEACGSLAGPFVKRWTPRAGMLGTLAGIAIVWIATTAAVELFENPVVGFPALAIVLLGMVAGVTLPGHFPPGLLAILVGTALWFVSGEAAPSLAGCGLRPPVPVLGDLVTGLRHAAGFLHIILPVEIYNFLETMNNVESAEAAGDAYPVRACQAIDGAGTMVGALFGAPFPTTVYIGHPAYKRLGGRSGYALAAGLLIFAAATGGLVSFLHGLIPVAAVAPMLLFIGLVITAQAFTAVPPLHSIGVAAAIVPHVAAFVRSKGDAIASCLDPGLREGLVEALHADESLGWFGCGRLAHGSIMTGLLWGSILVFCVERRFGRAAMFTCAAGALTAVGLIHRERIGLQLDSPVLWGYLMMAGVFLAALAWSRESAARRPPE
ncbi:MAG: xanthine/uracil/vitamin C permease [bacterium]|nr:xanthine/uracil/vitamin C permease [bacterium]